MDKLSNEYVIKLNGILYGQTTYKTIQRIVLEIKDRFPMTVQTPPHPVLQFSSQVLKKDKKTPGTITSTTGSHEHFLYNWSTISGIIMKRGEFNSVAQSLQDLQRIKCKIIAIVETVITLISIERKACFIVLNLSILIAPTQMAKAMMLQQIQESVKKPMMNIIVDTAMLITSHLLTNLMTGYFKYLIKKKISLEQIKVKIYPKKSPKYLSPLFACLNSSAAKIQKTTPIRIIMIISTINLGHLSSNESGRPANLMDQIFECRATPIVIAAFMRAMKMQPYQNFLFLPPLSHPNKNENQSLVSICCPILCDQLTITTMIQMFNLLKQFYLVVQFPKQPALILIVFFSSSISFNWGQGQLQVAVKLIFSFLIIIPSYSISMIGFSSVLLNQTIVKSSFVHVVALLKKVSLNSGFSSLLEYISYDPLFDGSGLRSLRSNDAHIAIKSIII